MPNPNPLLLLLIYFFIYNDSRQSNYLKIYRQIFRVGRTIAVDDRSEISFSITQRTLPWQPICVVLHGCRWAQAASGTARQANVGLCPASSFLLF